MGHPPGATDETVPLRGIVDDVSEGGPMPGSTPQAQQAVILPYDPQHHGRQTKSRTGVCSSGYDADPARPSPAQWTVSTSMGTWAVCDRCLGEYLRRSGFQEVVAHRAAGGWTAAQAV